MQISVSIEPYLGADLSQLKQYLDEIVKLRTKIPDLSVHFDYFVERPMVLDLVRQYAQKIPIDVHLMDLEISGTEFRSIARDIRGQTSITNSQQGLVFDLGISLTGYENLVRQASYITVMSVKCGRSGQTFNPTALDLVRQIRALNPQAVITLDGGINENNISSVKKAGVDVAVVGNYAKKCYEKGDLATGINRLLHV